MSEKKWVYVLGVLLILVSAWRGVTAGQLKAEKAEHEMTKAMLEASFVREKSWGVAYQQAREAIKAQQENAQACLDREQEATAEQWQLTLSEAKSRDMAPEEKGKVPDEVTRRRLFDALDRPL